MQEPIALHCIIHQQALCSKCLKFDNVMTVVVKCINQIRSRGLKHRRFRAFLEDMRVGIWRCALFLLGTLAQQGIHVKAIFFI